MHAKTRLMVLAMASVCLAAAGAWAKTEVYRWVDKDGVVHFGDQEPRAGKAEVVPIRPAPDNTRQPAVPEKPAASAAQPTQKAAEPEPTYAQKKRAERDKRRQEAAEKREKVRAECERAHQMVKHLEPSTRVMVRLKDGTVTRLDDNKRIEMLNDAKGYISRNCTDQQK